MILIRIFLCTFLNVRKIFTNSNWVQGTYSWFAGPWYLEQQNKPGLKHQRAPDTTSHFDRTWYPRGAQVRIFFIYNLLHSRKGVPKIVLTLFCRFKMLPNFERVRARTAAPWHTRPRSAPIGRVRRVPNGKWLSSIRFNIIYISHCIAAFYEEL